MRYTAVLRNYPRLTSLLLALMVSVVGDTAYFVALAGALLARHHSSIFALSLAAEILGGILMLPLAGVVVDRYDRLRVMIVSDLVQAVVVFAAYIVFRISVLGLLPLFSLMLGAASAFFTPAVGALLPRLVNREDLVAANALRSLVNKASSFAGPALAGVVLIFAPGSLLVLLDAVTFILSILLLTRVGIRQGWAPEKSQSEAEPSMIREALAGLEFVKSRVWILVIMLQGVFQVGFILGPEIVLVPIFLSHHQSTPVYGFVLSAQAAGAVVGALVGPRVPQRFAGLVAVCSLLLVAPELVVLMVTGPGWLLAVTGFLTGIAAGLFGVLWISALQRTVPDNVLGRVLSLDVLANSALQPLGIILVPALLSVTSIPVVALVLLVGLVVSTAAPLAVPGVIGFSDPLPSTPVSV